MKYSTKNLLIAASVGLLALPSLASPEGAMTRDAMKAKMLERFNAADADKNGVITHAEMMAKVSEKFNGFDKNKDGYLELKELPKIMPMSKKHKHMKKYKGDHHGGKNAKDMEKKMEKRMAKKHTRIKFIAKLDHDYDEKVSLSEFAKRKIKHFKRADENGDGNVTLAEMETAGKRMHRHRKMKMKKHHKMDK